MSSVIDASALLATLYGEPGADRVDALLVDAVMSAVNMAEVVSKLVERGMAPAMATDTILATGLEIVPVDVEQAEMIGALRPQTRTAGLSLGDRACLALAKLRGLPAVTAERAWPPLAEIVGVEVIQIRGGH